MANGPKFEFGEVDSTGYGECSLWCSGPSWRLAVADKWIGSSDDLCDLETVLSQFVGLQVSRVNVGLCGDLFIGLEGGASISVFVTEHFVDYNNPWILYFTEDIVSVIGAPPYVVVESGSLRRHAQSTALRRARRQLDD